MNVGFSNIDIGLLIFYNVILIAGLITLVSARSK